MFKKKNQKGFTLVELLVVIAIIGILAVVAVPALFKNINKAKVADLEADYNAIKSASLSYYTDKNTVPKDMNELTEYMESIPKKSALGDGTYIIGEETMTEAIKKSLFLSIGERKLECIETNNGSHGHTDECYKTSTGITLTEDQLKKLVADMGEDKVYISKGNTGTFTLITNDKLKPENISNYTGENCTVKLKLIDNTSM